jgi:hypothetical protein
MATMTAHGIAVDLPAGWDGHISVRDDGAAVSVQSIAGTRLPPLQSRPVVHLANFGLPTDRGDFGSGAVELMGDDDLFVVVFEYEPAAAHTSLFRSRGLPRALTAQDFDPLTLRRAIPGQSAYQHFFQAGGRAFCVYVVLGSHARRARLVPALNRVLASVRFDTVAG